MNKFFIPVLLALGVFTFAPHTPATPPTVTWNVEPVGMVQPHPPVEVFYNPFPRGTGRRQWADRLQSNQ